MKPLDHSGAYERPGWLGPLFYWEALRQSRKKQVILYRVLYGIALLGVLYLVLGDQSISQKNAAHFSEQAVNYYLLVQYLAALILTPILVAGTLIEDRHKNTLPLLLTTFLSAWEIVIGKLTARLLLVVSVLLTGLPILALLQLLGGVSFRLLVIHSLLALLVILVCGVYAIWASCTSSTLGMALFRTYMKVSRNALLGLLLVMLPPLNLLSFFVGSASVVWMILVILACQLIGAVVALRKTIELISNRDRPLDEASASVFQVAVHRVSDKSQSILAVPDVPYQSVVEQPGKEPRHHISTRLFRTPEVGDLPVLWKDMYFPLSNHTYILLTLGSCLAGAFFVIMLVTLWMSLPGGEFVRLSATVLMTVVVSVAALQAAGSFSVERQQQTLVSLLCTPLSNHEIVWQKWLASFWRFRHILWLTGFIALLIVFSSPIRLVLLAPVFLGHLASWSILGMTLSLWRLTSLQSRALVGALLFLCVFIVPGLLTSIYDQVARYEVRDQGRGMDRAVFAQSFLMVVCPYQAWSMVLNCDPEIPGMELSADPGRGRRYSTGTWTRGLGPDEFGEVLSGCRDSGPIFLSSIVTSGVLVVIWAGLFGVSCRLLEKARGQ